MADNPSDQLPPLWRYYLRFPVLRSLGLSLLGACVLLFVVMPRVGLMSIQSGLLLVLAVGYAWHAASKARSLREQDIEALGDERLPGRYRRI